MKWDMGWKFLSCLMILSALATGSWAAPPADADEDEVETPAVVAPPLRKPAPRRGFLFFGPRKSSSPAATEESQDPDKNGVPANSNGPARVPVRSTNADAPPRSSTRKQTASYSGQVAWQHDLKLAHRMAAASNKPILLVFGAPWCQACLRMERDVFQRPEIAEQVMADFIPVHVDVDRNQKLVDLLEVESIPAVVVLNQNLDLLKRLDGYQPAAKLSAALGGVAATQRKLQSASLQESVPGGR